MSRSFPNTRLAVLAVVGLTVVLVACSAATPDRDELVGALQTSGVPADVARCAADAIEDSLSTDELAQIVERGPGGAPADDTERTDDPSDKVRAALAECREQLPTTTVPAETTVPGASTVPGVDPGQSPTTAPAPAPTTTTAGDGASGSAPAPGSDAGSSTTDDPSPGFDTVPSTS